MNTCARLCLAFLALTALCSAWGLKTDSQQLARFVADHVQFNQKTGVNIFSGHVHMTQGSTELFADQLTVYKDTNGNITQAIALGQQQPAHYLTLPDPKQPILNAYGERIEYYPIDKQAVILGHGMIQQGPNQLNGSHIVYDIDKQLIHSLPSKNSGEQTILMLQPQNLPGK